MSVPDAVSAGRRELVPVGRRDRVEGAGGEPPAGARLPLAGVRVRTLRGARHRDRTADDEETVIVLELILPRAASVVEVRVDPPVPDVPRPESVQLGPRVSEDRRREFETGRHCALEALARLGVRARSVPRGSSGEPLWPPSVVGSITHCRGLRAAAVAHRNHLHGIGIDAEPADPLPDEVLPSVAGPAELERLRSLCATVPAVAWDRLLFSAKESVYKTWYPLTGAWLGFHDVDVRLDPAGRFTAHLPPAGITVAGERQTVLRGTWAAVDGFVLTAVTLPA